MGLLLEFLLLKLFFHFYGSNLCNDSTYVRERWTETVNVFVSGAFALNVVLNTLRLNTGVIFLENHNRRAAFYSVLTINSIAAISSMSTAFALGGVCIDGHGYVSLCLITLII